MTSKRITELVNALEDLPCKGTFTAAVKEDIMSCLIYDSFKPIPKKHDSVQSILDGAKEVWAGGDSCILCDDHKARTLGFVSVVGGVHHYIPLVEARSDPLGALMTTPESRAAAFAKPGV